MPIKECTLPEGGKGWQWGDHGKCYADRKDAEEQAAAAHANGFRGDGEWNEEDHPRNEGGEFSSGGGGGGNEKQSGSEEKNKFSGNFAAGAENHIYAIEVNGKRQLMINEHGNERGAMGRYFPISQKEAKEMLKSGKAKVKPYPYPDMGHKNVHPFSRKWKEHGELSEKDMEGMTGDEDSDDLAEDTVAREGLTFDRATVRRVDADGRMHVAMSNISKATVNPYYGYEIPGWQDLGLQSDRVYQLLRDPGELAKAVPTFNGIQVMFKHIPVSADDPQKEYVVGTTGTDAKFEDPYLQNSLVIWDSSAIAGIQTREQYELSCAYRYVPDMTPGTFDGVPYDGVMREIVGNHVALVEVGRAGPDVVVSDSQPLMEKPMAKKAKMLAVRAAIRAFLRPKMAADAALDLKPIIDGMKDDVTEDEAKRIATLVQSKAKMAKDANLNGLTAVIMDAAKEAEDEDDDDDDEDEEKKKAEDEDEDEKEKKAEDEDDEDDKKAEDEDEEDEKDKKAMDAAIRKAEKRAEKAAVARMRAISEAEKEVKPILGEIAAMDSAEAIYKMALDQANIDTTGVDPSAYRAMVKMHIEHLNTGKRVIAQDSGADAEFDSMFPGAKAIGRV